MIYLRQLADVGLMFLVRFQARFQLSATTERNHLGSKSADLGL